MILKPDNLKIICKNEIQAGESLEIELSSNKIHEDLLIVYTQMSGSYVFPVESKKIITDTFLTRKSGKLNIRLLAGPHLLDTQEINILPNMGTGKIESYIGPKSILTTTNEPSMLVAIPADEFDNPVTEGTISDFSYIRPNYSKELHQIRMEKLTNHHTFFAQTKTGKTLAGVQCDNGFSDEKYVDEEAGWPLQISLETLPQDLQADGKHYVEIKTKKITDKLGNNVKDGTIVTFSISDKKQINQYSSVTINGVAKIDFKYPTVNKKYEVIAFCGNVKSNSMSLTFISEINDFDIKYDQVNMNLVIGPVTGTLNQFVPDGSEFKIGVSQASKKKIEITSPAQDGMIEVDLKELFLDKKPTIISVKYAGKTTLRQIFIK